MNRLYERAEREIKLIENDDTLTDEEKQREIRSIESDLREINKNQCPNCGE